MVRAIRSGYINTHEPVIGNETYEVCFFGIHCIVLPFKTVYCELTVFFIPHASPWSFDSVAHVIHCSSLLLVLTRQ